jgi:hypothetical protein
MTTITITGKQPGKTDVTISSTVNPAVKTVVPVTVKSRNLATIMKGVSLGGLEKIRGVSA